MPTFYTYLHCKPDGIPFYVGKGTGIRGYQFHRSRNVHYKNIVAKYGSKNIKVFIFDCDSEAQALSDEIQQIAQLRNEGYKLCNLTNGGDGASGYRFTAEQRAALSRRQMGRKPSQETLDKIAEINRQPDAKERRRTAAIESQNRPDVKEKQRAIQRVVQNRPDVKLKKSAAMRASALLPENKMKRRGLNAGEENGNSLHSDDIILAIRAEYTGKRGDILRLAKQHGISSTHVCRIVHNKSRIMGVK
jgi:hypothetical protein